MSVVACLEIAAFCAACAAIILIGSDIDATAIAPFLRILACIFLGDTFGIDANPIAASICALPTMTRIAYRIDTYAVAACVKTACRSACNGARFAN